MEVNELKKKIENEYSWFVNEKGKEPNVAYATIKFVENGEEYGAPQIFVLDNGSFEYDEETDHYVPYIKDNEVFYYCGGINDFENLTEENCNDFIVTDIVEFEYIGEESK